MTETERIADQLIRAFEGETWSGRSIRSIVADLSAARAARHPIAGAHSAWELLAHVTTWIRAARIRLGGETFEPTDLENFPPVEEPSPAAWQAAWARLEEEYGALAAAIRTFPDQRLGEPVPGRDYPVYHLLHGVIQHSLYHAGQIALLARA